jgi:hypothetical protein
MTIAGIGGNVLEWYDFAVFGFFGDIIGDVFFPPQEGHAAIIESFAVFGGAFLMRPSTYGLSFLCNQALSNLFQYGLSYFCLMN